MFPGLSLLDAFSLDLNAEKKPKNPTFILALISKPNAVKFLAFNKHKQVCRSYSYAIFVIMAVESRQHLPELPPEEAEILANQDIPLAERIDRARALVISYGQVAVFVARETISEGNGIEDKKVPRAELLKIADDYGFPHEAYQQMPIYEWHTPSAIHSDLTMKVREGGIDIGGATDLFPNGVAWSNWDHTNTYDIVVSDKK